MVIDLSDQVVAVTGASSGIGEATALACARAGASVALAARRAERIEALAERIVKEGGRALAVPTDVGEEDQARAFVRRARSELGRLDVLVNNAGVGTDFGVSGTAPDFDAVQRALDTNFFGAYRLTIALLDLLRESAHPRIVNVSSGMGGVAEMGGWSPGYRVSKAALNAITRILATELKDDRFLINSACPGFVNTDMGGPMGAIKSVEDGAAGIVWLATLPDDGPTGGFFRDRKPIAF